MVGTSAWLLKFFSGVHKSLTRGDWAISGSNWPSPGARHCPASPEPGQKHGAARSEGHLSHAFPQRCPELPDSL